MGRYAAAGFAGATLDHDVVAVEAWSAAFDDADIAAAVDEAFTVEEIEVLEVDDDLLSLIARRPSRRVRSHRVA